MYRFFKNFAFQNLISRKKFTVPLLKYKFLKLKLGFFLAGYSVAMVTYFVTKMILACYKQLLDEVFVISRIIKVKVGVISRSRRLRLITLTETSIILVNTKTESNNCFITH